MKIYYAHCLALYDTPQEERDVETLLQMGFSVINPNSKETQAVCAAIRKNVEVWNEQNCVNQSLAPRDAGSEVMRYFRRFATECDAIAFRALPSGEIPAGVAKEIAMFANLDKPVIELPSRVLARTMSVGETRQYLREAGQR
jgi:hypothetical protein